MKFYEDDKLVVYNTRCEELLAATPDSSIDCILTDPPYGIAYESNKPRRKGQFKQIAGDEGINTAILPELYRVLKPNTACYLFTRWDVMQEWRDAMSAAQFTVKNVLVWNKEGFAMGDLEGDWATTYELILFCVKGDHTLRPPRRKSVITAMKVTPSAMVHPNEKPLGVWYPMIAASTNPGDIVLDPYLGSCSSLLACRQMNRRGVGSELDPEILNRVQPRLNQIVFGVD